MGRGSPFVIALLRPVVVTALAVLALSTAGYLIFQIAQCKRRDPDLTLPRPASPKPTDSEPLPVAPTTFDSHEIAQKLRTIDWFQFEKIVEIAYRKHGYAVSRRGGANPDGGIDLVVEKDGVRSAVQCKQWKTWNVGVKPVREFLGALTDSGIQRGIFVTLCGYTNDARELAQKHGIEMVTKDGLAALLESANAGSDPAVVDLLKDTRKYCPKCENAMVLRTATQGRNSGEPFWGCTKFPRCRCTIPVT